MNSLKSELKGIWKSNLGVMILSSGIWRIGSGMTNPFWPLYVIHLGGSTFHVGLISAVSSLLAIIPTLLGGYLADTLGRKKVVYSMSMLLALDTIIYIIAPSWHWLLVVRSLDAVFSGLRGPAFSALIADSTSAEDRAFNYGIWHSVPQIFGLASPTIIGLLMDRYGILSAQRLAYMVLMLSATIGAFLRWRYLDEPLSSDQREDINPIKALKNTLDDFRETIRDVKGQIWILFLLGGLFQLGASIGNIYMVNYATEDVIGLSASQWGFITTVSQLVAMIVAVPFAMLSDRYGRRRLALLCLGFTPIAIMGFIYAGGFNLVLLSYISLVLLGSLGGVTGRPLFVDHSPREHRGRISSMRRVLGATQRFNFRMMGRGSIIGATGNLLGGLLYRNLSYQSPFQIMVGLIGLVALLAGVYIKEPENPEK
ncbi:MAG: MFS transporter [Candidatus Bathyarchaeia archaeon]